MMERSTVGVACIVCMLSILWSSASSSDSIRWGITPKTPVQFESQPADDQPERTPAAPPQKTAPAAETQPAPRGGVETNAAAVASPTVLEAPPQPDSKNETVEQASQKKISSPSPPENAGQLGPKAVQFNDASQQETCEEYLKLMRALFLKTRHHSIQGAPCDTAEYATAFLQINEKSEGECPPGYIHQNGYSDRILRNIRYLEKLGNDRCAPAPALAEPPAASALMLKPAGEGAGVVHADALH